MKSHLLITAISAEVFFNKKIYFTFARCYNFSIFTMINIKDIKAQK